VIEGHDDRRLMAILFTDIAGYTTLTERDEATAIRVRERHRTLVRALATQFEGEVVDSTGDETLAIFASALHAVDCALALQAALRDDRDLAIRVGIHLGDVTRRGAEVIGEGVNVAARIRPLAEPGGIAISESVYQAVRTRPHIRATSLGAQALKNVTTPVNVFTLSSESASPKRARRSRWLAMLVVGAFGLAATGWVVWTQYRVPILASFFLAAPRYFRNPIEQKLGFATTTDGVRIAYATTGSGPPVLFVLGWGTHLEQGVFSTLYDPVGWIAHVSEQHLLVRYDGRGFGLSERRVSDFSLDARVRDIEAIADSLHLERFALYAISAGGPAAISYAARHPERVSRLVLVESSAGPSSLTRPAAVAEELDGIVRLMRTSWDSVAVRDMWISYLDPQTSDVFRRVESELFRVAGDGAAMSGFFTAWFSEDVSAQATTLQLPTLVIHGDQDAPVPLEYGLKLAALIPGSRLEILKGANHSTTVYDPRTLKLVTEFLAQPD
jgi:pimeloyl-ACP methyl ester carboxylesterase/class 3 adenylate cyclase